MKRCVLLSLVLVLALCVSALANEPETSLGTTELDTEQAIAFGVADFADVGKDHWAYESVKEAVSLGITAGRGGGTFAPNDPVTRAEFITMLHRLAGKPAASAAAAFTDVESGSWYAGAIAWAAEQNVTNGVSETLFGVDRPITRQELVTVLFRLSGGVSGAEVMFTSLYDQQFADSGAIASWAKSAMYWGVYKELIRGAAADALSPEGTASRAEAAAILVRYNEKIN